MDLRKQLEDVRYKNIELERNIQSLAVSTLYYPYPIL